MISYLLMRYNILRSIWRSIRIHLFTINHLWYLYLGSNYNNCSKDDWERYKFNAFISITTLRYREYDYVTFPTILSRPQGCEIIACSTDSEYNHLAWTKTPRESGGLGKMNIPLLADRTQTIATKYGVLKVCKYAI